MPDLDTKIKIALLVPCFNASKYLPQLIESVRLQTSPFDEILLYDDASTDNTVAVAGKLGVNIIRGASNKGAAYARNRLLEHCKSNWTHFHDSDDLIHPRFVEKLKSIIVPFQDNYKIAYLSNMLILNSGDLKYSQEIVYDEQKIKGDPTKYFLENDGYAIIGCYSRKVLKEINGFCEVLRGNEDPDLHVRLAIHGVEFKCLDETLVTNVIREDSFSALNWNRCMADKLICIQHYSNNLAKFYHKILSKQAAELSNYFYRQGNLHLSNKARALVSKLGGTVINSSHGAAIVSRWLGIKTYLWIYRRRVDLKLVKK